MDSVYNQTILIIINIMDQTKKSCIIITTINFPSPELLNFLQSTPDIDIIIIGDIKTPNIYSKLKCTYLDINAQNDLFTQFSKKLPLNHYSRKNIGYMYAIKNNYDVMIDSDDDTFFYNINKTINNAKIDEQTYLIISPDIPNVLKLYSHEHIWPRGFPLNLINKNEPIVSVNYQNGHNVYLWQGLVDNDPDVDAIYRMTAPLLMHNVNFKFENTEKKYILNKNILTAGNTQNTIWTNKNMFYLSYIPSTVSFRYCDILRSYIAQYGFWANNGVMGIMGATAYQNRNSHDLMNDFESEMPIYLNFYKVKSILDSLIPYLTGTIVDLKLIYQKLYENDIVEYAELDIINEWIALFTTHEYYV